MNYNDNAPSFSPGASTSTLTAFFDSRSDAESAVERMMEAGISTDAIRLLPGYEADSDAANDSDDRSGFWATLEGWFFPDEDRATYAEGLRRGGFLVSVQVDDASYNSVHEILDDEGSIDMDERADNWRASGWESRATAQPYGSPANVGPQEATDDVMQPTAPAQMPSEDTFDDGSRGDAISVVEENLKVGKRDVNSGSVRVRAYTVEHPVREDVTLRDENVEVERRAVDRQPTDADRAFENRTISVGERYEEGGVSKDARSIEEIGIRKTASDGTETIAETVRKTEVEADDRSQPQNALGQSQGQGRRE